MQRRQAGQTHVDYTATTAAGYASQLLLLAAWGQRWRQHRASADEVNVKLGKILLGADPPHSEAAVQRLLHDAGFGNATRFFSSLFWAAWLTCKVV